MPLLALPTPLEAGRLTANYDCEVEPLGDTL